MHATYTRLIVDTGKHSVEDAQTYMLFVLEHLRLKSIFQSVDLKV